MFLIPLYLKNFHLTNSNYTYCEQDYNILAVVKLSLNVMDVGTYLHVEKCYNFVCLHSVKMKRSIMKR